MTIKFSENINLDYSKKFKLDSKVIKITYDAFTSLNKLESWSVVSLKEDQLQIKLKFTDNRYVSAYQIKDSIKV